MAEPAYPLPPSLVDDIEHLLRNIPDRGDTVFNLRRHFALVYALGYQDGRFTTLHEQWSDRRHETAARAAAPTKGAES